MGKIEDKYLNKFKSFFNEASGSEGDRCNYPIRLDLYGRGCQHNCSYCYAKSLLYFRNLWNENDVAIVSMDKVIKKIRNLSGRKNKCIRLGGMTDCFQPIEEKIKNTYHTIRYLNKRRIHYLIVTKSDLIARDRYLDIIDKDLAHIQISISSTDKEFIKKNESGAPKLKKRIKAIEKIYKNNFDISIRLSPFIVEKTDIDIINDIRCNKILVEFLRINSWIIKWLDDIDFKKYKIKDNNYRHLSLIDKLDYLEKIDNSKEISVCEDVDKHYLYFKNHINEKRNDCCNLDLKY